MEISRNSRKVAAFVLTWDNIQKLHAELTAVLTDVEISAECADGLTRRFNSLEELGHYSNPSRSAIIEINFAARKKGDFSNRCSISFQSQKGNNCRISIDANETIALKLNEFLEDYIESLAPWYGWMAKAD